MQRKQVEAPNDSAENAVHDDHLLQLVANLVSSYVRHNRVPAADIGTILKNFHASLSGLSANMTSGPTSSANPAVAVKKSIGDDYLICLEDGKKLKMLKRYLRTRFSLTPAEYRAKWQLPRDYPMVAPAYARKRSALAKKIGLGTIPGGARGGKGKRGVNRQVA